MLKDKLSNNFMIYSSICYFNYIIYNTYLLFTVFTVFDNNSFTIFTYIITIPLHTLFE